jgi:DNA-binding transcriptional LysR family regulator
VAPLHFVACGAPSYFAARGLPLSVTDLSKHNCLRLRGHGASQSAPWKLGPQKSAESLSISGDFLANDIPALVTTAVHGQGLVFAPLPLVSSLVSNGRPEADLAGVRLSAHTYLHSLREPQASCRAREGFREFHA